ncbi:MAG: hypothetical protein ABIZ81_03995 [Opitutaceae bacterium]
MRDEPDPPRKIYELGKAEFKRVNATPATAGAAAPAPAQDVQAHLRDNLARAKAAGLNELAPQPPRASRRKRDYWTLFLIGNGFFGIAVAYWGPQSMPGAFAFSGMILFSAAITWLMWVVMDRY